MVQQLVTVPIAEIAMDCDVALRLRVGFQGPGADRWHVNTTLRVTVHDNDSAEAESYWMLVNGKGRCDVLRLPPYMADASRNAGWGVGQDA